MQRKIYSLLTVSLLTAVSIFATFMSLAARAQLPYDAFLGQWARVVEQNGGYRTATGASDLYNTPNSMTITRYLGNEYGISFFGSGQSVLPYKYEEGQGGGAVRALRGGFSENDRLTLYRPDAQLGKLLDNDEYFDSVMRMDRTQLDPNTGNWGYEITYFARVGR